MIGTRLGSYEVVGKLGEGGMGAVYRARDTKLNREVAIKVLPDAFASDPDRLARFTREAQTLAALNHPNVCILYGVGEASALGLGPSALEDHASASVEAPRAQGQGPRAQTVHFLVMELVEGRTLEDMLQRWKLGAGR